MQEQQLYALWQALSHSGQWVSDGQHRLRVLQPGQLNLSSGPDFTAACFELDGVRISGDVEMHIHQNDWYRHEHHLDNFYRNVVLHVVSTPPPGRAEVYSEVSRRHIPSFYLDPQMLAGSYAGQRCRPPARGVALSALKQLALRRLKGKMRFYGQQLQIQPLEQVFYEAFLRVLGYPNNARPFQRLARRMPWPWLVEQSRLLPEAGFDFWYALYAGQAGFLRKTTNSTAAYPARLRLYYDGFRDRLPASALSEEQWQWGGVRGVNHPHFRLAGWVAFWLSSGRQPLQRVYRLFEQRLPFPQMWSLLRQVVRVPVFGYWARHHTLGGRGLRRPSRYFFGLARLAELLINLFLPLFCVLARQSGSVGFEAYLKNFYFWLPQVTSYQAVLRYFPWWKAYAERWPRQAVWQGFIQLYREFCELGNCAHCPLRHRPVDLQAEND